MIFLLSMLSISLSHISQIIAFPSQTYLFCLCSVIRVAPVSLFPLFRTFSVTYDFFSHIYTLLPFFISHSSLSFHPRVLLLYCFFLYSCLSSSSLCLLSHSSLSFYLYIFVSVFFSILVAFLFYIYLFPSL